MSGFNLGLQLNAEGISRQNTWMPVTYWANDPLYGSLVRGFLL
jgi:hypothetical protein